MNNRIEPSRVRGQRLAAPASHGARRLLILLALCTLGWSPPDSTEVIREQGPSFSTSSFNAGIDAVTTGTIGGWMYIFSEYTPPLTWSWDSVRTNMGFHVMKDTFTVTLPTATTAAMSYHVWDRRTQPHRYVPVPLITVRDTLIPPWGAGRFGKAQWVGDNLPAQPGVAWHAFIPTAAQACTLVMWGYAVGSIYSGHLTLRSSRKIRPDSTEVRRGFWWTGHP